MEICAKCGLPKQACICEQIVKSSQRIRITTDKKRYGKIVTIVSGFDKGVDIRNVTKIMKNDLACGGTYDKEKGLIELQGDHTKKAKDILVKQGFEKDSISE